MEFLVIIHDSKIKLGKGIFVNCSIFQSKPTRQEAGLRIASKIEELGKNIVLIED